MKLKLKAFGFFGRKWKERVMCPRHGCRAVYEVDADDLVAENTAVAYAGETWEPRIYVYCPECGQAAELTYVIPQAVRDKKFAELRGEE